MNKVVEWGLAVILGIGGCSSQQKTEGPQDWTPLEQRSEDPYQQGLEYKAKALKENDRQKRVFLLAYAETYFDHSIILRKRVYSSLLEQADCLSLRDKPMDALTRIERVLQSIEKEDTKHKDEIKVAAYDQQAVIALRHNIPELAVNSYTEAIKLSDTPLYRWRRFESILLTMQPDNIQEHQLNLAFEDAQKYAQAKPNEPEGYLAQYNIHAIRALANEDKEEFRKAYDNLRQAFKLIDDKKDPKPLQAPLYKQQEDALRRVYEKLQLVFPK